jgi:hypothetical protein
MFKKLVGVFGVMVGALLGMAALPARAAIDVSAVVSTLTGDGVTAVTSIGVAVLAVIAIVAVFKFVRRAV